MSMTGWRESASSSTRARRTEGTPSRLSWDERYNFWIIHPIKGKRDSRPRTWLELSADRIRSSCTDECVSPHYTISLAKCTERMLRQQGNNIMRSLRSDLNNKDAINGLEALRDDPLHTNRPRYGHNIALGFKWHSPCTDSISQPSEKLALLFKADSIIYLEFYEIDSSLSYLHYEAEGHGKVQTFRSNLTERLRNRFADSGDQHLGSMYVVLEQLCYLILDDESQLLSKAGKFLRECDNKLASRITLDEVTELQEKVGKWRGQLHVMNGWCTRYIHNMKVVGDKYKADTFERYGRATITKITDLVEDLNDFQRRINHIIQHTESTFSTLRGTISLLGAQVGAKLTWVAFAVVPINVMVAFCGQSIQRTFGAFPVWGIFGIGLVVVLALEIAVYVAVGIYQQKSHQRLSSK